MRILLLKPAGDVYDRTFVRVPHAENMEHIINSSTNTGDFFVHDATLKLLDFSYMEAVPYKARFTDDEIKRYNSEFDVAVIRGSNYLHSKYQFADILPVLEKLTIPIVAFAFGCQAARYKEMVLPAETIRALKIIEERSVSMGVRGDFTAETLNKLGFKHVRPIGCPSIFRNNWPTNNIQLKPWELVREVGLTTHRGLGGEYCENRDKTNRLQRELIESLSQSHFLRIVTQGETAEKILYYQHMPMQQAAIDELIADQWIQSANDSFYTIYKDRLYFGQSAEDYARMARGLDLMVGVRLHGNVMALGNGVPAIYIVYDSRTREFAEGFHIPHYNINEEKPFRIENYYQQDLFDQFAKGYETRYQQMAAFLTENGLKHHMRSAA